MEVSCIAANPQPLNHVGVSNFISDKNFSTKEEAHDWLSEHEHCPYVSVVCRYQNEKMTPEITQVWDDYETLYSKDSQ